MSLALSSATAFATAALYAYVGLISRNRSVSGASRRALDLFSVWWGAMALLSAIMGLQALLGLLGVLDLPLHFTIQILSMITLSAALWGLLYYLLYIHTGEARLFWPITIGHALLLSWLVYLLVWRQPLGVVTDAWEVEIVYEQALAGTLADLVVLSILAPVLVASAAYATLLVRTRNPMARYRIGVISGGFLVWFGVSALANFTALADQDWWPLASRGLGLLATSALITAYRPPRILRERLRVAYEPYGP